MGKTGRWQGEEWDEGVQVPLAGELEDGTIKAMSFRVWIDQDLCTGDGICCELAPDVFWMHEDGLAYVKEEAKHFGADKIADASGAPILQMGAGMARVPDKLLDVVVESAEECPGECIFIEPAE